MSIDITIPGGQSRRLLTGGKYCPDDIVVTATGSGAVLPDLKNPGEAGDLMAGKQLLDGAGRVVDGTFTIAPELAEQAALIDQIRVAVQSKTVAAPVIQALEITENGVFTAPEGVDGYSPISVHVPVPEGYVKPAGELEITENGSYDVAAYARVSVAVAGAAAPDPRELYQRVEYITSAEDGTYPYIITDFYADNESGLEVIASFPILQDRIPMGSRENSEPTRFYCVYPMSSSSIYYGFNTGSSVSCTLKTNTIYRLQTNFLNSRLVNVYDEDGNRKGGATISGTLTPAHTVPVSIFGYNYASNGTISSKREFKLYSARCSRGHEVVRKYVPVRRKADGEVGLYEEFSGTFWGNDAEVGAFAAGPDIDW